MYAAFVQVFTKIATECLASKKLFSSLVNYWYTQGRCQHGLVAFGLLMQALDAIIYWLKFYNFLKRIPGLGNSCKEWKTAWG